jgi:hypothetical protein
MISPHNKSAVKPKWRATPSKENKKQDEWLGTRQSKYKETKLEGERDQANNLQLTSIAG